MSRKQPKRRTGSMAYVAIAGLFIAVIVCGVGFGVASADSIDDVERSGAFGLSKNINAATFASSAAESEESKDDTAYYELSALASTAPRDLNAGMHMIDEMERAERARIAAENAAVLERVAAEKAKQGVAADDDGPYGLSPVDWSVGKAAYMAEWTARIDNYLAGSPLEGYGAVFADAAWVSGVDPRWSPAISNTESGKGLVCFRPCNAWGWGNTGWPDWETAIRAHVAGLAEGYGYSITQASAQAYCPPTWESWYGKTLDQMSVI